MTRARAARQNQQKLEIRAAKRFALSIAVIWSIALLVGGAMSELNVTITVNIWRLAIGTCVRLASCTPVPNGYLEIDASIAVGLSIFALVLRFAITVTYCRAVIKRRVGETFDRVWQVGHGGRGA